MRSMTGIKRVLAIVLTLALLLSMMAVVGVSVSAAEAVEYHYTFDATTDNYNYRTGYYKKNGGYYTNNCIRDDEGVNTDLVAGGYNGSEYLMQMAYVGNRGGTYDSQRYAAFSLPNNTGSSQNGRGTTQSIHLVKDSTYTITLTYKVTGYVSTGALYVGVGGIALSQMGMPFSNLNAAKVTDVTAVTDGWQTATVSYTPTAKNTLYVILKMADDTNRAGTTVQIGAVDIVPTTVSTITFDAAGGSEVAPISGNAGETITYPANPTRVGYEFAGWFTADDGAAPTVFPSENLTLIAKWNERTAPGTEYHYTFDATADNYNYRTGYYKKNGAYFTNNCIHESDGVNTDLVAGGYNGSEYLMQMAYTGDRGGSYDSQRYAAFSLPNNTGSTKNGRGTTQSIHLEKDCTFKITLTYKVTGYVSAGALYVGVGGIALSQMGMPFSNLNAAKVTDVTAVTDGWQTASVIYTPTAKNTLYVILKMADDTNRAGTTVQIGAVDIEPVLATTISFVGADVAPITGQVGETIVYPADPTRAGFEFIGWFTADDEAAPTVFPSENLTLVAKWNETAPAPSDVWSFESEAVDTLLSVGTHSVRKAVVTAAEHKSGAHSLKLTGNDKSGYTRPQVMIKDNTGAQVMLQEGLSYEISFWLKVPQAAGTTEINWWLTASADDTYYDNSNAVNADKIYEQNRMSVLADVWLPITVNVHATKSGMLRLGMSGNRFGAHDFYIDDIAVKVVFPPVVGEGTLTFETGTLNTDLALNGSQVNRIEVTDEIPARSGTKVARVTSNDRTGNTRPQMLVKNDDGDQIYIYKGRNYEFTFSVFIPEGSEVYGLNYWFAAASNEQRFDSSNPKKNYVLAEVTASAQPTPGEWATLTLTVADAPVGGKLRFGITGNTSTRHSFYIDDITVRMTEPAAASSDVQSYEDYSLDEKLSVNTDAAGITATDEDVHTGYKSAKVVTLGNAVNTVPQMPLIDYQGEPMTVVKGMKYQLSFYAMVPYGTLYDLQCWLTVADNDTPYSDEHPRENVVMDTTIVPATDRGGWQFVTLTISDCAASGDLRLGISGSTDEAHTFYIDDLMIRERSPLPGDPEAMNFESTAVGQQIQVNTGSSSVITITDEYSFTGSNAARVDSHDKSGDYRPQLNITDADGNLVRVSKGEDCYITFMIHMPTITAGTNSAGYWLAAVPEDKIDTAFNNSVFTKNDYKLYEATIPQDALPDLSEWVKITIPVLNSPLEGVLRLGVTFSNLDMGKTNFIYIDDVKKEDPRYVTVKFDTNGSEDEIDDIVMLEGSLIPFDGADPYLDGSDFMGWYTDKAFKKEHYFDIYSRTVTADDAPVLTLYARWRKWDDGAANIVVRDDEEEYVTEYYTEKVWVGDQNVPAPWDTGDRLTREDAAPIVTTPDEPQPSNGMPPWLIVVIIVAAVVVVGGGAVVAAVMLKKSKKA